MMECTVRIFKKPLSDYIAYAWGLDIKKSGDGFCKELIVPSGFAQIMFNFGGRMSLVKISGTDRVATVSVSGLFTKQTELEIEGSSNFLILAVKPDAAKVLFNFNPSLISDEYEDATYLLEKELKFVAERMSEVQDFSGKIKIIEDYFLKMIAKKEKELEERVSMSVSLISESGGGIKISKLADMVFCSKRNLERMFMNHTGVTLKDFSKVIRFQKTLSIKQKNPDISLTRLAFESGYSDQAHFINDFKSITSLTPGQYFFKYSAFSDFYL